MKKLLLIALVAILGTTEMNAQRATAKVNSKDKWEKIGEATIDLQSGNEAIITTNASGIKAIKLEADKSPMYLDSFDVVFAQGEKQTVAFGGFDPVKLNGNGKRTVTQVIIRAKSIDNNKSARVAIMGLKNSPSTTIKNERVLVSR